MSRMRQSEQERFWAKVEKTEGCWNWTGGKIAGYGNFALTMQEGKRTSIRSHRYSWQQTHGPIPEDLVLDHICHNTSCVRPDHLRAVTRKQNSEHRLGANRQNASGVRGVHFVAGRWRAGAGHGGVYHSAGSFPTKEEAVAAVLALRLELFTHNDADRRAA